MSRLEEQIAALSDTDFKRLYEIMQSAEQKMKGGYSYSSEVYSLEYEFPFSAADLMDLDTITELAHKEAQRRGQA
ncbi:MAG: hypothetical protein IKZ26_06370 [Peptococcaceae bacterium]|nr:hypothetical protein [Peptococcaceae bacterium]